MSALRRFFAGLRGPRLLIAIGVTIALLVAVGRIASSVYVEILWQAGAGYNDVFWQRVFWQWGLRIAAGVGVGAIVFLNLRLVARTLNGIQIRRKFGNLEISEQLPKAYVLWGIAGVSALLGLWFGAAIPINLGLQILLVAKAGAWGVAEPIHGHDVGFYVFWVPVLASAVIYALTITFLVFTLSTAGYAATGALRWTRGRLDAEPIARVHLGATLAVFLLVMGARLWLSRYLLLLDGSSGVQGIFGFADAEARLPAMQTLTVLCIAGSALTMWGAWKDRPVPILASFLTVVGATIVIGQLYPSLIQSFRVEPNELVRETPFIEHNLEFTRRGFGLDELQRRTLELTNDRPVDWAEAARQFDGLPVWTRSALLATYRELEALRPYYDFQDVTIDQYPGPNGPEIVAVAVREVDPGGIQDPNWQNQHLRELYVEGMGVVASLATARTDEGRPPMLVSGIPPTMTAEAAALPELTAERSEIFFGARVQDYAVVNPSAEEYLAPDSSQGLPGRDFPEGIELASGFRTALLAWMFQDANLLFASDLTDESRFIHRRSVIQRVRAIAPFLRFPEPPYPVVEDGQVVWLLEGFTATAAFPLSAVQQFGTFRSQVTYARNSVKVTVDAITGDVEFYRVPIEDPLLDAYAGAFPALLKPLSEMPDRLRNHVRYSRELLNLQSRVMLQYHQESAPTFHGQRDVWSVPQELAEGTSPVPYRPEYGFYTLPGETEERFHLSTVFVPTGRQNLTALLAARTDESGAPELLLYDLPLTDQVPGPRQIEALIEQDPQISQQFSLWRTGGSEVWTGHLHLVPAGDRILYMEPVFLAAEADAIPELRRFVVSDGRRVAMTETLEAAIRELAGADLAVVEAGTAPDTERAPMPIGAWPAAALDLLDRADSAARDGDWTGFGVALEELRALLERIGSGG